MYMREAPADVHASEVNQSEVNQGEVAVAFANGLPDGSVDW